jgi:hypothetical protein
VFIILPSSKEDHFLIDSNSPPFLIAKGLRPLFDWGELLIMDFAWEYYCISSVYTLQTHSLVSEFNSKYLYVKTPHETANVFQHSDSVSPHMVAIFSQLKRQFKGVSGHS